MLTDPQRQILEILILTTEEGRQASVREMADIVGCMSNNAIACRMNGLIRKGFISTPTPTEARSIRILRDVDGTPYMTPKQRLQKLCRALGAKDFRSAIKRLEVACEAE